MARERDYGKEYSQYHGKPAKVAERSQRNKARRQMASEVGEAKIAGKDVHHKNPIRSGGGNGGGNLGVATPAKNRAWRKGQKGQL
jgi:hypothetical protein